MVEILTLIGAFWLSIQIDMIWFKGKYLGAVARIINKALNSFKELAEHRQSDDQENDNEND